MHKKRKCINKCINMIAYILLGHEYWIGHGYGKDNIYSVFNKRNLALWHNSEV